MSFPCPHTQTLHPTTTLNELLGLALICQMWILFHLPSYSMLQMGRLSLYSHSPITLPVPLNKASPMLIIGPLKPVPAQLSSLTTPTLPHALRAIEFLATLQTRHIALDLEPLHQEVLFPWLAFLCSLPQLPSHPQALHLPNKLILCAQLEVKIPFHLYLLSTAFPPPPKS